MFSEDFEKTVIQKIILYSFKYAKNLNLEVE